MTMFNKLYYSCFRGISLFFVIVLFYLHLHSKHSSITPGYRNNYQIPLTFKRLVSLTNNYFDLQQFMPSCQNEAQKSEAYGAHEI